MQALGGGSKTKRFATQPFESNKGVPMSVDVANYGAENSGLVYGYLFAPGEPGRPLDSSEALAWLALPAHDKGRDFLWLHFNLAHASAEKWLKAHLELSEVFYEALHEGSRSTRIEYADGALIAVVNDVQFDFSFEASDISTLWLSVNQHVMISARRHPLRSIDRLRVAVRTGETFRSAVELLVSLLRLQADVLVQIVRQSTQRVDHIEDRLLADRLEHKRVDLGALRRVLVRLQRLLAPEPAALFRLLNRSPRWIVDLDIQELRQSTEEFSAVLADMMALQERIKLLQEEIAARINEQNNRSLYVLTIVTVLALPFNVAGGLLGMNVGGIPLAQHAYGFWIVVTIVAVFTLAAGTLAFRKRIAIQDGD